MSSTDSSILVVEDEGIVAENIRECLIGSGYSVVGPVDSGEEAIRVCSGQQIDLALMDIQLAGNLTGLQAADEIRSRYSVPIVFLTAFSDTETIECAQEQAPYGYVVKPFSGRELEIAVKMALAGAAVARERNRLLNELQTTVDHVTRLQGLLPICAHCKRIRDDDGYWKSVERYLNEQLKTSFSHGICPKCCEEHYPFMAVKSDGKNGDNKT